MNLYCKRCGTKLRKYKTTQHKQIKKGLEYMGIPCDEYKYKCPKCYEEV